MKYLFLLFLSFNAFAATPETCLEMMRGHLLLLESGALEKADKQLDLTAKHCYTHVADDSPTWPTFKDLIEADKDYLALQERVEEMGL